MRMTVLYWICCILMGGLLASLGVSMSRWQGWAMLALLIAVREISRFQFNGPAEQR